MEPFPRAELIRVQDLAREVHDIAGSPEQDQIRRRWRDINALRKPDRAPVWTSGTPPLPDTQCSHPFLRKLERRFLSTLAKISVGDDTIVDDTFGVAAVFNIEPENIWGLDIKKRVPEKPGGAWGYDPPLRSKADYEELRLPTFKLDREKTEERVEKTQAALGKAMHVELRCPPGPPLLKNLGSVAAELRGQEQLYMDTLEDPESVHRLMGHLRDGVLKGMDEVEATGLLTPYELLGPTTYSDPLRTNTNGKHRYRDSWVMANNQALDMISPQMWEEFILQYQKPILARFGRCVYGCCDNLTKKIDGVLSIPNLGIFVCSAWTDLDKVVERIGRDYVIMWRQKASDVVMPDDTTNMRMQLDDGAKRLQGCRYQIVLREVHTLAGHPDRLHEWTRYAKEAAEKYA